MSVQTGRTVSADEAREIIAAGESQIEAGWGGIGVLADVAHTVVVQAEQIAAALALHTDPDPVPLSCPICDVVEYPCLTARALGVSGE